MGSKNFLTLPEEKEWPKPISDHIALIREKKMEAIHLICKNLLDSRQDKTSSLYFWDRAIGLDEPNISNNLKTYLFLLIGILYDRDEIDETNDFKPLADQAVLETRSLRR